jgi:type IV pilus assembly protein PilC
MKKTARFTSSYKLSHTERLLFTKHISVLIKAGIPITEALETLRDESKSKQVRQLLQSVYSDIQNGLSLTDALKKHPKSFDELYVNLVYIGEKSGTLEKTLQFLSVQLTKDYQLRKKIQGAMLYPALVFFATIIMGSFIAFFILPKLVDFFEAFDQELPLTTQILLWFASFMKQFGVLVFVITIFCVCFAFVAVHSKTIKPYWHSFLLKLPLFGTLLKNGQLSRFCRNLGILLQSGVSITQSLSITARSLSNITFSRSVQEINESIKTGKTIAATLSKKSFKEFPPLVGKMIAVGEKTGKLDESLLYLSDFYEDEIDSTAKNLSTILEPILLLTIGLIVGFVALAIITPIYQLTGNLKQ